MRKIFSFLCSFIFLFCFFVSSAFAAENFLSAADVTYTVRSAGLTHVEFVMSLTNTSSQFYASSYSINVGFEHLLNLKASDPQGSITPRVTQTDEGQTIALNFNKRVVGIGNTLQFHMSFDTPDVAKHLGTIWEVNIPGLSKSSEFSKFDVHVRVPASFGNPAYVKPSFSQTMLLDFTKEDLQKSGISIAFGTQQIYDYELTYHIQNTNIIPIQTEISLPPTTNYQESFIDSIEPQPTQVVQDADGNWLARFSLLPSQRKDIVVKGKALLKLKPHKQPLSSSERAKYLTEQPYWQVSNADIQAITQTTKTPQEIYDYVVQKLKYDFSRVLNNNPRIGAAQILKNPDSAVCLEFTDLFIALARAAGIPAREIDGFAVTDNSRQRPLSLVKDVLHAWPEYYDDEKQAWIMIDPTWENTTGGVDYFHTLDFDHLAFTIKGMKSEYPIPAGGYKLSGQEDNKDVNVTVSDVRPVILRKIAILKTISDEIMAGFPLSGTLTFRNVGNALLDSQEVVIQSSSFHPNQTRIFIKPIPPFGTTESDFSLGSSQFLTNKKDVITISVADKNVIHPIKISPFSFAQFNITGGMFYAGISTIILSVIAITTGCLLIFQRRK